MSTPDEQALIQQVTEALAIQHNPTADEQRRYAMKFTEEFKIDHKNLRIAFPLIHGSRDMFVRHFGMSVLEHHMKHSWNTNVLSDKQKESIKSTMLTYISLIPFSDVQFLKEKICSVLIEVVKNEVSTKWKNIVSFLVQMVEKDSDQAELVLISLRTLIEEMHTMPKNKAKIAINNIIDESSKTLFPYIYYQLNKFYMLYTQLKQSNDNPEALKLSVAMIKACLKLLISLCEVDWMPLGVFHQEIGKNIIDALIHMLTEPDYRLEISEIFVVLLLKKERNKMAFMANYIPNIKAVLDSIPLDFIREDYVDEKIYTLVERLNQTISLITHSVLDLLNLNRDNDMVVSLLKIMLDIGRHPSLIVSNFSVPLWKRVIAIEQFHKQPYLQEMCLEVIQVYSEKLMLWNYEDELPNVLQHRYRIKDFYDRNDYLTFIALMKNNIIQDILSPIAQMFPKISLQYISLIFAQAIELQNNLGNDPIKTETANVSFVVLRNHVTYISKILTKEMKENRDPELNAMTTQFCEVAIGFTPKTSAICVSQLAIITSTSSILQTNMDAVMFILKKMLETIGIMSDPPVELGQVSEDMKLIRFTACMKLLEFGKKSSTQLVGMIGDLMKLIYDSKYVFESERIKLYGFLMAIGNELALNEQAELARYLATSYVEKWCSPEITTSMKDLAEFDVYFKITTPLDATGVERRENLILLLKMIESIWSNSASIKEGQTEHPLSNFDLKVLPNIFQLVKIFHHLWSPEAKNIMGSKGLNIYEVDQVLAKSWLRIEGNEANEASEEKDFHKFFINCRILCYKIIGHAATHIVPLLTHGFDEFIGSFVLNMEYIDVINWKYILKNIMPSIFKYCIPELYGKLTVWLESSINVMKNVIETEWKRLQDESFPTPEAEILAKRASYETANDLLRYFQEILVLVAEPRSYTPYFYFLLNHGKLSWIITILSDVISWNETNLSVRACKMISEILSHLRSLEMGEIFKNEPQSTSKLDESLVQTFYLHTIKILINSLTQQPKNTTILLQLIVGLHEFRLDKFNHVLTTQYGVNPDQLKKFNHEMQHGQAKMSKEKQLKKFLESYGVQIQKPKLKVLDIPAKDIAEYLASRQKPKGYDVYDISGLFE